MANGPVEKLRSAIVEKQALILVGSGVSIGATRGKPALKVGGIPKPVPVASWSGLLYHGIQYCEEWVGAGLPATFGESTREQVAQAVLPSLLAVADQIEHWLGGPGGGDFGRWLKESVGAFKIVDRSVLQAIAALGSPIATTNYDRLLEEVTDQPAITWKQSPRMESVLRNHETGIIHLHGVYDDPSSVVLSGRSYQAIVDNTRVQETLKTIFASRTVAMVGFGGGLNDPNFGPLMVWLRAVLQGSEYPRYRLCLQKDVPSLSAQHPPGDVIRLLPFGEKHGDLAPFLQTLAPSAPRGRKPADSAAPKEAPTATKRTRPNRRPGGIAIPDLRGTWQTSFTWDPINEQDPGQSSDQVRVDQAGDKITGESTNGQYSYHFTAEYQSGYVLGQWQGTTRPLFGVFLLRIDIEQGDSAQGHWLGNGAGKDYVGKWIWMRLKDGQ